ncbi:MAG: sodium:solute symporter family protein, partial [Paraburkholderia sp.]
GATLGLIAAVISTTIWYLMGDPYGIDNIYVALVTPLAVMFIDRLIPKGRRAKGNGKSVSKSALRG